ncbi:MAG: hypothetical protein ABJF86_16885 [Tateyamaria sp.]|uniref:hypothetical protein n=1 Tax=Tateyamaria sp. TaxID=1929288 RepID=UPI003274DEF4
MKLFSLSVGLLLAAFGVLNVPVSFAVDGFGLVVSPGGVRTIRADEQGMVMHFPATDGGFLPGQLVSAVVEPSGVAENALLLSKMRRELSKVESDYLEKSSKIQLDIERDQAKQIATVEQLKARGVLMADTDAVLDTLQEFAAQSTVDISDLNDERLSQLAKLEDLVKRSGEVAALPAQRLATMMEEIQAGRLSVIASENATFSTDRMILDMTKGQNDLAFSNSIDLAEIDILGKGIADLQLQLEELARLRASQRAEAEASYLAKSVLPQVAVSSGYAADMRTLQASRADVAKSDPLRLLATGLPTAGLSFVAYGAVETGQIVLGYDGTQVKIDLPAPTDAIEQTLRSAGLDVHLVHQDEKSVGATVIRSLFIELSTPPEHPVRILKTMARNGENVPLLVTGEINLPDANITADANERNQIIGFLENRHAVVLERGQSVRGSINNARTGTEIVFDARVLNRDFSAVDTKELGIRVGNQSLADKIIKRGVLSQVVVEVDAASAHQIENLSGAVVHLSFPLGRQTLFSFLMARNAAI